MREEEEEEEEETRGSALSRLLSIRDVDLVHLAMRILIVFGVLASVSVKVLHWADGPPLQLLRVALVCLLASFTIGFFATLVFGRVSEGQWHYMRTFETPLPPWRAGYFVAVSAVATIVFIYFVWHHAASWRTIQVLACIAVAIATTHILVGIGSRQISKILRYGYYATALILVAEAVMVMLLGGPAENG
ncbi:hypothetical protein [Paraburkholderia sp. MM5477-R1]|uniref:hypothetical protein n=1 Tax=Paraburkholderia sp. MM5477-R1 TaxID=2991062 RepID=UPI003D1F5C33